MVFFNKMQLTFYIFPYLNHTVSYSKPSHCLPLFQNYLKDASFYIEPQSTNNFTLLFKLWVSLRATPLLQVIFLLN